MMNICTLQCRRSSTALSCDMCQVGDGQISNMIFAEKLPQVSTFLSPYYSGLRTFQHSFLKVVFEFRSFSITISGNLQCSGSNKENSSEEHN